MLYPLYSTSLLKIAPSSDIFIYFQKNSIEGSSDLGVLAMTFNLGVLAIKV